MKQHISIQLKRISMFLLAGVTLAVAEMHFIEFGGIMGPKYFPDDLVISSGDTLIWSGDFREFPLSSLNVPHGASSFGNSEGKVFQYVVTVPGLYQYQCTAKFDVGMAGSFTAAPTNVMLAGRKRGISSFRGLFPTRKVK